MKTYITGLTALNLLAPGRRPAGWHTHGLVNRENWCLSEKQFASTEHLLGDQGLYDATDVLRRYAPDTPDGTLAASYERAVFDLLYHFIVVKQKPVPNVQAKDIDDAVDFTLIADWIESADLSQDQRTAMLDWLLASETFYVQQNRDLMSQIKISRRDGENNN